MRYMEKLKKISILSFAALSVTAVSLSESSIAQTPTGTDFYLSNIMQYTQGTMQAVQQLPEYLRSIVEMCLSWMTPDTGESSIITNTQADFAALGQAANLSSQTVDSQNVQAQLLADLIGVDPGKFSGKDPQILNSIPYINNIAYSSMVGLRPVANAQFNSYDYVKFAAGLNIPHPSPNPGWQGSKPAIEKYTHYFNTIAAIQSFNAYVLGKVAADAGVNQQAETARANLISKASDSAWIAQIATEELGKVLREILLFESQNYVLNAQAHRSQSDLLVAQAMTNSLLILYNRQQETQMLNKAMGVSPSLN